MRKFFVRLLCCFIPNREYRHTVRRNLSRSKYDILIEKFNSLLSQNQTDVTQQINDIKSALAPKPVPDYSFDGKNNKLLVWNESEKCYTEQHKRIKGLDVTIHGNNNVIKLDDVSIIGHLNIILNGFNHSVHIGKSLHTTYASFIRDLTIITFCNDTELDIGDNFTTAGNVCISLSEPHLKAKIGNNVRLAENTRLFVSDAHPIVDAETGKCLNYGGGGRHFSIGNNCWIGMYSYLGKNTVLPDYTIVGAHSVVTKPFTESYTVIAGVPARVVKKGVLRRDTWQEVLPPEEFRTE